MSAGLGLAVLGVLWLAAAEAHWSYGAGNPWMPNSVSQTSTCSQLTPCYDVTLTFIIDGPFEFDQTPGRFREAHTTAGRTEEEALQIAREALEAYREGYGMTFGNITDDALLDNTRMTPSDSGDVMLVPVVFADETRFRFYSATYKEEAQFFNVPVLNFGYAAMVTAARAPTGSKNLEIPAGAMIFNGQYFTQQCPPGRPCPRKSILTPGNPAEDILIRYQSLAYSLAGLPPTNYLFTECVGTSALWGQGSIRGYFPTEPGTNNLGGREVITFPVNINA